MAEFAKAAATGCDRRRIIGGRMQFRRFDIDGPVEIIPHKIGDERGYFAEVFREDAFVIDVGDAQFVQDNQSLSVRAGTIRGIHFQTGPFAQESSSDASPVEIFDVAVDLRQDSPSYGRWISVILTPQRHQPAVDSCRLRPRLLHARAQLHHQLPCNQIITAEHDKGVAWDDPEIAIEWPDIADPETLSAKDRASRAR